MLKTLLRKVLGRKAASNAAAVKNLVDSMSPEKPVFGCPNCEQLRKHIGTHPTPVGMFRILIYANGHAFCLDFEPQTLARVDRILGEMVRRGQVPQLAAAYTYQHIRTMVAAGERSSSVFCFDTAAAKGSTHEA